jgi:hypothetical protein
MAATAPPLVRTAVVTLSVGQRGAHGLDLRAAQGVKDAGGPEVEASCSFTDTVTERLPFGLAAKNWV